MEIKPNVLSCKNSLQTKEVTEIRYEKQNETTPKKKKKRNKLERKNSEVVRFELAPPKKDTKHLKIIHPSIHCATTSELGERDSQLCQFFFLASYAWIAKRSYLSVSYVQPFPLLFG